MLSFLVGLVCSVLFFLMENRRSRQSLCSCFDNCNAAFHLPVGLFV